MSLLDCERVCSFVGDLHVRQSCCLCEGLLLQYHCWMGRHAYAPGLSLDELYVCAAI